MNGYNLLITAYSDMNEQSINSPRLQPRPPGSGKNSHLIIVLFFLAITAVVSSLLVYFFDTLSKTKHELASPVSVKDDLTSDWKVFRNEQLGIEFKYPSNYIIEDTGDKFYDYEKYKQSSKNNGVYFEGRQRFIRVSAPDTVYGQGNIFILSLYSSDVLAPGGGCPTSFAFSPGDLSFGDFLYYIDGPLVKKAMSSDQEGSYFCTFGAQSTAIKDRQALKLYKYSSSDYSVDGYVSERVVTFFNKEGFSDMEISGPFLMRQIPVKFVRSKEEYYRSIDYLKDYVQNKDYKKDEQISEYDAIYNLILSTFKFID